MNRRKLIRKMATPAVIIFIVSLIVVLLEIPLQKKRDEAHKEEFKKYFSTFMEQNRTYLKGIAGKIKSLPVNQVVINELQSEYMVEHQRNDISIKYLWMSDVNGNFLFGTPKESFEILNNGYDKYLNVIKIDDYYRSRNDFLIKLIDMHNKIDFAEFDKSEGRDSYYGGGSWRYYKFDSWEYAQSTSTSFSTPVFDPSGKIIGELFLKVDDSANKERYFKEPSNDDTIMLLINIFRVLLIFSGIFLWFLLPTWVYTDAQDRDVKTPGVWAFLALTSLIFGLTIYLITRPSTLKSMNCPKCDGELNGTRAYCPHCGEDLSNNFCQQCQYPIKPEWQFCPNCRAESKPKEINKSETFNT